MRNPVVSRVRFSTFRIADDTPRAYNRSDIESCSDNGSGSKSFDISHGRLAKEAAVFSVELADALVADLVSCTRGVHPIHKHPLPCPLQPQRLLVLKRAHRGQCAKLMMKC